MSSISERRNDPEFEFYISGIVALHLAGECLEPFTRKTLTGVHEGLKRELNTLPLCTKQCSEQIGNPKKWCNTCQTWKQKLEKLHKTPRKIKWKNMHSWLWPKDPYEIAEVFSGIDKSNMKDISNIFTVWNNCTKFDYVLVMKSRSLKGDRNKLFHDRKNISSDERDTILHNIKDLIREKEIKETLNNFDAISNTLDELGRENIWFNPELLNQSSEELLEQQKNDQKRFAYFDHQIKMLPKQTKHLWRWIKGGACMTTFLIISCLASGYMPQANEQTKTIAIPQNYDCLLETHEDSLLRVNFSMTEYLRFHTKTFSGREWLYKEVEKLFLLNHSSHHGIILMAEMGYGKSAFIANLVCAQEGKPGINLRKHLAAYHLCRFESRLTRNVGIFIHRLVSMLSVKLNKFAMFLKKDRTCLEYYSRREECDGDMYGCFDHCVLFPLRKEPLDNNKLLIIAIDALDECVDDLTNSNILKHLLENRVHQIPAWMKILITSRKTFNLSSLGLHFHVMPLISEEKRNIKDITKFLKKYNETVNGDMQVWNFQFLKLILSQNDTNMTFNALNTEASFAWFYTKNFKILYGNNFAPEKQILSIICASREPMEEETLIQVVVKAHKNLNPEFVKMKIGKLQPFVNVNKGKLSLIHFSLKEWLINGNAQFQIDLQQGNFDIGLYYTDPSILEKSSFDAVDLLIHISQSAYEMDLVERFKELNTSSLLLKESLQYQPIYHRLAVATSERGTVKLAMHHFKDIDATDRQDTTALYKAASLGNLEFFIALIESGANMSYRIPFPKMIDVDQAMEMITYLHWGFGILDIAAMNGHTSIVRYILNNDTYDFNKTNAANLLPIHLACKFDNLIIIRLLHQRYSWMLDDACLYYSAMKGFDDIVIYCLENNIADKCVSCNTTMYWIQSNQVRLQGDLFYHDSDVVLYDDWRLINCETALHSAVMGNKTDTVRLLLGHENNHIDCYDRTGKTPLMYAITSGHSKIVNMIINDSRFNPTDSCKPTELFEYTSLLSKSEFLYLNENSCPERFSLMHMSLEHDMIWLTEVLKNHYIESRGDHGCHPLHYAACQGSVTSLDSFSKVVDITQLRCTNGSLLIHSASVCGSLKSIDYLKRYFNKNVTDRAGRTIAMYAVSRKIQEQLAVDGETVAKNTQHILAELNIRERDILEVDDYHRSILHYAVASGQYSVVTYLLNNFPKATKHLVKGSDLNGLKPFSYGIEQLDLATNFFFNHTNLFKTDCSEKWHIHLMSPVEYTLFKLLLMHSDGMLFLKFNYLRTLTRCVQRNKFQLFAKVFSCARPLLSIRDEERLFHHLSKHDASGAMRLMYMMTLTNREAVLNNISAEKDLASQNYLICKQNSDFSLIHYLAFYLNDLYQLIYHWSSQLKSELTKLFFSSITGERYNSCYDSGGFNVLERAIQGGNLELVKILLDNGLVSNRTVCELLLMSMIPEKFYSRSNLTWDIRTNSSSDFEVIVMNISTLVEMRNRGINLLDKPLVSFIADPFSQYDKLVEFLLKHFKNQISAECICTTKTLNISLIHYLAIQNFRLSIKTVSGIYGKSILRCRNYQNFSALYFAYIFNSTEVIEYMESNGVELQMPSWGAEQSFLFALQTQFYFNKTIFGKCFPSYIVGPLNTAKFRKVMMMARCFRNTIKHFGQINLLYSTDIPIITMRIASMRNYQFLKTLKVDVVEIFTRKLSKISAKHLIHLINLYNSHINFENLHNYVPISHIKIGLIKRACVALKTAFNIMANVFKKRLENGMFAHLNSSTRRQQEKITRTRFQMYSLKKNVSLEMSCFEICRVLSYTLRPITINEHKDVVNGFVAFVLYYCFYTHSTIPQFNVFYQNRLKQRLGRFDYSQIQTYQNQLDDIKYTSSFRNIFLFNLTAVYKILEGLTIQTGKTATTAFLNLKGGQEKART